jgi:hypothetical protein
VGVLVVGVAEGLGAEELGWRDGGDAVVHGALSEPAAARRRADRFGRESLDELAASRRRDGEMMGVPGGHGLHGSLQEAWVI